MGPAMPRLVLAASHASPADLRRMEQLGFELDTRPEALGELIAGAAVAFFPIRDPGPVRHRVLEAMAAGRPVVATGPAAQGLAVTPTHDIFIANQADSFATDLIRLSGLEVGTDIEIRFSGTRPGEKLYEELFFDSESALPTGHPKVLRAKNGVLPLGLSTVVDLLVDGARRGWSDDQLRNLLGRLVPDFRVPAPEVEAEVDLPISSLPR
jgi:hypothetical protein